MSSCNSLSRAGTLRALSRLLRVGQPWKDSTSLGEIDQALAAMGIGQAAGVA